MKEELLKKVKAVVCDVDGTLLTSDGVVSPVTAKAIRVLRAKGILFGIATGRDAKSVEDLLEEWGIAGQADVIIGSGGAEIRDVALGIDKASFPLEGSLIREVMNHYQDMEVSFVIPFQGVLYAPEEDERVKKLSKVDKIPYEIVDFDEFLKTPRPKVMIVCKPELMDAVVERSKTFHNEQYKSAALKTASILFEYMDPRISKTHGLEEVAELHGFSLENICTFGDADNDFDMTQNAGIGVVMANGSEKTKSAADYITEDNNHDGIGNFINQYLL